MRHKYHSALFVITWHAISMRYYTTPNYVDVFQTVGKSARSGEQIVNVQNFFFRGYIRAGELLRMVTFAAVLRADRKSPHDRKVLYCSPEYL